jgi:hypothetical protein
VNVTLAPCAEDAPAAGAVIVAVGAWFVGVPPSVTAFDGLDSGLGPTALTAATVNVYDWPACRPVTVPFVCLALTFVLMPPGYDVIWYDWMELPPLLAGACHATAALVADPGAAVTFCGADGAVRGALDRVATPPGCRLSGETGVD